MYYGGSIAFSNATSSTTVFATCIIMPHTLFETTILLSKISTFGGNFIFVPILNDMKTLGISNFPHKTIKIFILKCNLEKSKSADWSRILTDVKLEEKIWFSVTSYFAEP